MSQDYGDHMKVIFMDGSTATANLVVAADGIHLNVRFHYIVGLLQA
jgi:2-polyprenyl-6-methoxyphenol hydroxylase-like FAD-dependent oxidoreductase